MKEKDLNTFDFSSFVQNGITQIASKIDIDYEKMLPKRSEVFTGKVLKDSKGKNVTNEAVHNCLHRFLRKARAKGFNRFLVLGAFGHGKSLLKGTRVLMYDCSVKKIENVVIGDLLMGDDGTPRKVLNLGRGNQQSYKVTLKNKDSFSCNADHKIPFYISNRWKGMHKGDQLVMTLAEYLEQPEWVRKNVLKIKKANLDWEHQDVPFDPYVYGVWLGDGHKTGLQFTLNDDDWQIADYLDEWAEKHSFVSRFEMQKGNCSRYDFSKGQNNSKPYFELDFIKSSIIDDQKRIKSEYLRNSREIRLQLLAGLIDTDGYLFDNCFEWSTKYSGLKDDFLFLCRSLGFKVSQRIKVIDGKEYYVIIISGYTDQVPCKTRKKAAFRKQIKNSLVYGFDVEDIGEQDYYGVVLDGNHLYLQEDFTIHHNTEQLCLGYALYRIAQNPNILIKLVHLSDTEASARTRAIRDYIQRDDDFKKLAPHIIPTKVWGSSRFIVKRTNMAKDGTVESFGILSTSIGGRANLIIFDDPQDLKSAVLEPSTRQRIEDTFKNVWLTRLIPDDGEALVMMNKWHENDLATFIKNNNFWSWCSIAVTEDMNNLDYKDSFGAHKILPLWTKFDKTSLEGKLKDLGERDFDRGYRLIPYSDNEKTFPSFESCCKVGIAPEHVIDNHKDWVFFGGIDIAGKTRPGTVIFVLAVNRYTGLKIPVEIIMMRGAKDLVPQIVRTYKTWGTEVYKTENNGVQGSIIDMMESALGQAKYKRLGIKIEPFLTGSNKADPMNGLPSIDREFEKQEWLWCFEDDPDEVDSIKNNAWATAFNEFKHYPFYSTTDIVMGAWFAREGAKEFLRGNTGPNIW